MTNPIKKHFLFLISSGRATGNSELLAQAAAEYLPADFEQTWLDLKDYPLELFEDRRHGEVGYSDLSATAQQLALATLAATDIVMVAPTYWYSLPAPAKLYLDHWTQWLRDPELHFREKMPGKSLRLITVNSGETAEEDEVSQPLLDTLRLTAEYMDMRWAGALIGHGNKPGEVLNDQPSVIAAKTFLLEN